MFSIVMPAYNRAYVIWKAISSVVAQSHTSWELLVVDDQSTDDTLRVLEEFADPRIRVLTVPHGGPSRARNAGLQAARGEFTAYLDSDNTWAPTFLERFAALIADTPQASIWHCGRVIEIFERRRDGGRWRLVDRRPQPARRYRTDEVWALHAPDVNSLVHRRTAALRVDGWDPDCTWIEDWDFFLRLWLAEDGRCAYVPDLLVRYRQVHGEGADGICAEFREDGAREVAARRYLVEKWRHRAEFDPATLERDIDDLQPVRATRRRTIRRDATPAWAFSAALASGGDT
jgi:glycosyltransferase involved in cell wall biosynthesis